MAAISVDDLHVAYPPRVPDGDPIVVLRGLSMQVPAGRAVALMGPTGSGKTTLALALAGLVPAMTGGRLSGTISVDGVDAVTTPAAELSRHVGLLFQEPEHQLFNMTVADEVAFGLEGLALSPAEIDERVAWVLDRVGLHGLEERPPWQLSGGEQKRLAIATMLAVRPPILLLDEPMAGLDPVGRDEVTALLEELKDDADTTLFVVEQDAEFVARWAERVLLLDEGQIVADAPPDDLFRDVDRLEDVGIAVPQMAALAAHLRAAGADVAFTTVGAAVDHLHLRVTVHNGTTPGESSASVAEHRRSGQEAQPPPALDVQSVTYRYPDGPRALRGISLTVPSGQFLAVIGANGSGKSTLARQFNGLLRPDTGEVFVRGRSTRGRAVGELAREVGYVFQHPDHQIFAPTVHEEIAFGAQNLGIAGADLERRLGDALEAFGLRDVRDVPPAVLGYGLRRLVTVASVWAMRPPIWVLDEPTTGLDARYTRAIVDRMRDLHAAGHTIVLITHDVRLVAAVAERVVVLHQGRVVLDGPPDDVFAEADALRPYGIHPPPIVQLSAALAEFGVPHPTLTVESFVDRWRKVTV